jgi:hypothetical protein
MKILITESKLFNAIYQYLDSYLNANEIDWIYGSNEDDDEEYVDNENFLIFYKGYYLDDYESNVFFHYFKPDYFDDNSWRRENESPTLEVIGKYAEHLDTIFDEYWYEPMKKWFEDKFNLPVKSVSAYYNED